jgi:glycosyltransferase involved in cell wall biosynthesis
MQENFRPGLSVVVPLFNEEESVPLLYKALVDATTGIGIEVELIFVDDGSGDDTFGVAEKLALKDSRLRVVKFRRNYGQTPAMAAGIDLARGDLIITMDGDLQNDPRDISHFVEKINEGFDIVVGWRHDRQDKLISRKIPSKIANWIIGKVTGVPIKDNGCSLKAFRADVIKTVPYPCDGLDRWSPPCRNQGQTPCTTIWRVEIRAVARIQGAAGPADHQNHFGFFCSPALMVCCARAPVYYSLLYNGGVGRFETHFHRLAFVADFRFGPVFCNIEYLPDIWRGAWRTD